MKRAMMINAADNVVVMAEAAVKGDEIYFENAGEKTVFTAATDVPVYHKVAIKDIAKGERATKYGCTIGVAMVDIPKGSHVHVHNIESDMSADMKGR